MIHRNGVYTEFRSGDGASEASLQLEREGYALLQGIFAAEQVEALRQDIDRVFEEYPADGRAANRPVEEDEMFRYEMLNRSSICQRAVADPAVLSVIEPLIGEDCHIIANTAWRNRVMPEWTHGGGHWHIDAGPHIPLPEGTTWPADLPHPVFAIGCHIYLQDCTMDDGPTGVIPGSHLTGRAPPRERIMDPELTWQGQGAVPLLAEAGDVGLFVSDVWHRRMPTGQGDKGRYFLQVHYGRRDIAQRIRSTSVVNHLSNDAVERAGTKRERHLIGLHENFFYDG
jgi:ectoine hydroxylase-related dioxygenase (phytanoyl-CoA dioxygenase family)